MVQMKSLLLALGLISISPIFSFSQSKVNIDDIEKTLACQCECAMTVEACQGAMPCSSAAAISEEIRLLAAQGKDKEATLKALVGKYGEKILSAPTKKGFNLTAWIFPFLTLLGGAYLVQFVVRKWAQVRKGADPAEEKSQGESDARYQSIMEKELREFEE